MEIDRLRREICFEAARLLSARRESNYTHAKWRAARSITSSYIPPEALPTDFEIRQSLQDLVAADGESRAMEDPVPENRRFHYFLSLLLPLDRVCRTAKGIPKAMCCITVSRSSSLLVSSDRGTKSFCLPLCCMMSGKGIDPFDHVAAGLLVLDGYISDRTRWLIENHGLAQRVRDGVAGARSRRRLTNAEDGDALDLLTSCDREGRLPGRHVCTAEEAIEYIRQLEEDNESWDDENDR